MSDDVLSDRDERATLFAALAFGGFTNAEETERVAVWAARRIEALERAIVPLAAEDCTRCKGRGRYAGRVLGDFMADGPCEVCDGTGARHPKLRELSRASDDERRWS